LLSLPVISTVNVFGCTSRSSRGKISVICITSARVWNPRDLHEHQLAVHRFAGAKHLHFDRVRQLVELLVICSTVDSSPCVTIVMRDSLGSCVGDVERVDVVAAPAERPATRVSTPNLFSTKN